MGESVKLRGADGHELDGYLARPEGGAQGGIVVCQEVFGVNAHIRAVTESFAAEGYLAVAPALFDRRKRGVELVYDEAGLAEGRGIRTAIAWEEVVSDVAAAVIAVREAGEVGVVGYCWGGSVAWLAACRLEVAAAVGYYGGQIHEHREARPRCPVLLHFGEHDPLIAPEHVAEIRAQHPEVEVFTYPAGHGFNCDQRADFDEASAELAKKRSLAFLAQHLA